MRKTILLFLIMCLALNAQFAKLGINGMKFLDIGLDARAIGLGEAYASLANGASAVFWNPACLSLSQGIQTFFGYSNWWAGIIHGGLSVSYDMGLYGKLAVFYTGLYASFEKTEVGREETGEEVFYYAYQVGTSYSRFLTDRFAFGLSLKALREKYPPNEVGTIEMWGIGIDIGGFYKTEFRDLKIGLALLNFGPDARPSGSYYDWEDGQIVIQEDGDSTKVFKEYPLPMQFKGGISMNLYEVEGMKVIGAFDIASPGDNVTRYCLGIEGIIQNILSLRIGYDFGRNDEILGFNTGIGINVNKVNFDYAFSDGGHLPFVHRVSLKMGF